MDIFGRVECCSKQIEVDTLLDIAEINEKIAKIEKLKNNDLINFKNEMQTMGKMLLKSYEERIVTLESNLQGFNITPSYISLNNRRIVKAGNAIDTWDLVTKSQLDKSIPKIEPLKNDLFDKLNTEIKKLKINFFAKLDNEIKKLDSKFTQDIIPRINNIETQLKYLNVATKSQLDSMIQKRSIGDDTIENKIKELEDKLNVFTIKDNSISVNNRRIIDVKKSVNENDVVIAKQVNLLSDMLENKINKLEEKVNSFPIDQFGAAV